jgi:hypothetical protein
VARTHKNENAIKTVIEVMIIIFRGQGIGKEKKNKVVNSLITKILVYSAIKIIAKVPLLYSVLNPDTSSDSPSAKSKGVRLVSAKVDVNQINMRGAHKINIGVILFKKMDVILKDIRTTRALKRIKDILTS